MWYFSEHNKDQLKRNDYLLNWLIKRFTVEDKTEERVRKSRKEYLKMRWTGKKPVLQNYSEELIDKFIEIWNLQRKEIYY